MIAALGSLLLVAGSVQERRPVLLPQEIIVRVLDPHSRPIAGAEVNVLTDSMREEEYSRVPWRAQLTDVWDMHERLGERLHTDSEGRVHLSLGEGDLDVIAASRGLFGTYFFSAAEAGEHEMRLGVDRELVVQVVDSTGAPRSGVNVVLLDVRDSEREPDPYAPIVSTYWNAVTAGPGGVAILPHAQTLLERPIFPWQRRAPKEVRLGIPLLDPVRVPIDPASPYAPLRLQLPPTGSVTVEMADAPMAWTRMRPAPAKRNEVWWARTPPYARIEHGRAQFPYVQIGLELEVEAAWKGMLETPLLFGPGPKIAGEEVVFRFEGRDGPGGIVLDPGRPAFLEGTNEVEFEKALLSAESAGNDSFQLCLVPADKVGRDRQFNLHFLGRTWPGGWHGSEDGAQEHLCLSIPDRSVAEALSSALDVPLALRVERPYALTCSFTVPDEVRQGEPAPAKVVVTNVGSMEITHMTPIDEFELRAWRDGNEIFARCTSWGGVSGPEPLAPGAYFTDEWPLERCLELLPGEYQFELTYSVEIVDPPLPFRIPAHCPTFAGELDYPDRFVHRFELTVE